jgi:hypothetical protein
LKKRMRRPIMNCNREELGVDTAFHLEELSGNPSTETPWTVALELGRLHQSESAESPVLAHLSDVEPRAMGTWWTGFRDLSVRITPYPFPQPSGIGTWSAGVHEFD